MSGLAERIIDYECGNLDEDEVIELFQDLVDDETIYHLQGNYQRTANALIAAGLIDPPADRGEN